MNRHLAALFSFYDYHARDGVGLAKSLVEWRLRGVPPRDRGVLALARLRPTEQVPSSILTWLATCSGSAQARTGTWRLAAAARAASVLGNDPGAP